MRNLTWLSLCGLLLLGAMFGASPAPTEALQVSAAFKSLLDRAPDSGTRTLVWYGALGDLEATLGVSVNSFEDFNALNARQRRAYLLETNSQAYFSPFSGLDQADVWLQQYGINSYAIDRELTVGTGRTRYGILQGTFDATVVSNALAAAGYQNSGNFFASPDPNGDLPAIAIIGDGLIVAPANAIGNVIAPGQTLGADADYAAAAAALGSGNGGALISAVLFDGRYLNNTVFGQDRRAQLDNIRGKIGLNEFPLPEYRLAGIGYRFDGSQRTWVVAIPYDDPGTAQAASDILAQRLRRYTSLDNPGAALFDGWEVSATVDAATGRPVAVAIMRGKADVAWVEIMRNRDVGFLATQ
jgi:hypothetical protein